MQCIWKKAFILNFHWQMCLYKSVDDIHVSSSISKTGNWEGALVTQMLIAMQHNSNSTLLDIGGNIGYYTLAAASAGFDVNVFEPVPLNAAMIQNSISRNNFKNIKLHTSALSDSTGELAMGTNRNNQGGVHHQRGGTSITYLPTMRLDNILKPEERRSVYIKIDIEGGECDAFKGMKEYISRSRKIIGLNMEFAQSRKCCEEWVQSGGIFDILHFKHNLCPGKDNYNNVCELKDWDLLWMPCP